MEPEDPTPYEIISVIHRSSFIKNQAYKFSRFVNSFASQVYLFLFETLCPRVSQELQECLHPPIEDYVGDWFLFEDYTIIIVYGFEIPPYRLPTFLTPIRFALEVLRKRLHSNSLHFTSRKQVSITKIPITIGPFTVRRKDSIDLIDDIMACFGFFMDLSC